MKVLYTGTVNVNDGGPAFSSYNTACGLNAIGIETHILAPPLGMFGKQIGHDVSVHYANAPWEHMFCYNPTYKRIIKECGDFDIYQAQGIWKYNTYALVDVAKQKGKPYVITPRGMLYPQDIAKSNKLFKLLSLKIRLLNDLNNAACVHTTCEDEMRYCRELGVTVPIAVIPNPIEIKQHKEAVNDGRFRLGYLGRISKRKNIESLIYAWKEVQNNSDRNELVIIGGGDDEYMTFLKAEVARLSLHNVRFTGFKSGEEKENVLSTISVLAMPSEFENFGNVIIEGLARNIPCIATKGSPWKDLQDYKCGWWIDYSQTAITQAVKTAIGTPVEDLHEMGINGRKLVESKYSIGSVANQFKQLYEWILGLENQPSFVHKL